MTDAKYVAEQEQCRARFEEELDGLSPARLLLKLYDVAIAACAHEERERLVGALSELIAALSFDHREISMPLFRIYDHCIRQGQAGNFGAVGENSLASYRVSKFALNGLTLSWSGALTGKVAVNAFDPGWVKTDMGGPNAPGTPQESARGALALALLPFDVTGKFWKDGKEIPW